MPVIAHGGQPARSGSSHDPKENRLGEVIHGVAEQDTLWERAVSDLPGSSLQVRTICHRSGERGEPRSEPPRQFPDAARLQIGTCPKPVIDMERVGLEASRHRKDQKR